MAQFVVCDSENH